MKANGRKGLRNRLFYRDIEAMGHEIDAHAHESFVLYHEVHEEIVAAGGQPTRVASWLNEEEIQDWLAYFDMRWRVPGLYSWCFASPLSGKYRLKRDLSQRCKHSWMKKMTRAEVQSRAVPLQACGPREPHPGCTAHVTRQMPLTSLHLVAMLQPSMKLHGMNTLYRRRTSVG